MFVDFGQSARERADPPRSRSGTRVRPQGRARQHGMWPTGDRSSGRVVRSLSSSALLPRCSGGQGRALFRVNAGCTSLLQDRGGDPGPPAVATPTSHFRRQDHHWRRRPKNRTITQLRLPRASRFWPGSRRRAPAHAGDSSATPPRDDDHRVSSIPFARIADDSSASRLPDELGDLGSPGGRVISRPCRRRGSKMRLPRVHRATPAGPTTRCRLLEVRHASCGRHRHSPPHHGRRSRRSAELR